MDVPDRLLDVPLDPLLDWARAGLAAAGFRDAGAAPVVRRREWSTVVRLDTDRGPVWVKANARDWRYEAALQVRLARWAPDVVLAPVLVDEARGWLVTPHGGDLLRSVPAGADWWAALLQGYAGLQRRAAGHVAELRALGLPDMTPATLPRWYAAVLERADAEPDARRLLPAEDRRELERLAPVVRELAGELAGDGLPVTVEHIDLHPGNVLSGPGGLRVFDWADAALAHPFLCLGGALDVAAGDGSDGDGSDGDGSDGDGSDGAAAAAADRLRQAYLRCWTPDPTAPVPDRLRRSAAVAECLFPVVTAASWLRLPLPLRPDFAVQWAGHLQRFRVTARLVAAGR
ncbi:phosphotransferase [Nakamurella endophytica]|uniref:Aminoglycoside phosphotransferase domain-containing protein n=1 Tax=Nakamurella endophytica TaxID=1748367 RepID=A0A917WB76_9ACTN|nr:phosphotransferase [Nakamurella endophytica]GGL86311.1 hypothetical protein GCM10011594_02410 [Nakamurella endophytica]